MLRFGFIIFFLNLVLEIKSNDLYIKDSTNLIQNKNIINNLVDINPNNIKSEPKTNKIYVGPMCDASNCNVYGYGGVCISMQKCLCNPGFITTRENFGIFDCDYKQKSSLTAALLEFLFPLGVGHLYARNYSLAGLKFISFFIFLFFSISGKTEKCKGFDYILKSFFSLLVLFDTICYLIGFYNDGFGYPLY